MPRSHRSERPSKAVPAARSPSTGVPQWISALVATAAVLVASLVPAANASGQEVDSIPGVRLGLLYQSTFRPALAVKPFTGRFGGSGVAPAVEAIMARDLRYSDRFEMMDSLPAGIVGRPGVDYALWDQLGAVWLLTGRVEGSGDGYVLLIELHDVVYGAVEQEASFTLPSRDAEGFRMAVHRASDAVVEWVFDEPGMAASRIAFSVVDEDHNQELYLIDSDGENLERITNFNSLTLSPAWSPDGRRLAYISYKTELPALYQMDLVTGEEQLIDPGREGQPITPAYSPDGSTLSFSLVGGGSGIFSYDVSRDCCLNRLTQGRWEDLSPTYSPGGERMAFNSNRLGTATPQIYLMSADGGDADLISPYIYGDEGYFTSPDWSPTGDQVAFHGRIERGRYHILVADLEDRGRSVTQLTSTGNNEDPSWAPDGRHLVFVGERNYGYGLFVVDTATGRTRMLLGGMRVRIPAWSPQLGASVAGDGASGSLE